MTSEDLREQTLAWLRENLPPGWMDAIDAGDDEKVSALRQRARLRRVVRPFRRGGVHDADVAEEAAPGCAHALRRPRSSTRCSTATGCRALQHHRDRDGRPHRHHVGERGAKHRRLCDRMDTDEEIWCQLFSEPGAGSDLAGLATRAGARRRRVDRQRPEGVDDATRTSPAGACCSRAPTPSAEAQGHHVFVVDMQAPGVEVRPLRQITGEAEFNEVFFDDVRGSRRDAPRSGGRRLAGHDHDAHERAGPCRGAVLGARERSRAARSSGCSTASMGCGDPCSVSGCRRHTSRPAHPAQQRARGDEAHRAAPRPGPKARSPSSCTSESPSDSQALAVDLEGHRRPCVGGSHTQRGRLGGRPPGSPSGNDRGTLRSELPQQQQANTIEGGTSDIMRNILGERVLGLPKDPDVSRDVAWKDVLRS